MYIQLFRPIRSLRYCAYVGAVVDVLFYLAVLITKLALTIPGPGRTFQEQFNSPRQAKMGSFVLPTVWINLVLDVYILVLPIAGVSKLQLPLKRKIGVLAIFMTGLV